MVNLGVLNWFDSFIKKLKKKSIGLYQPCDLYPCICTLNKSEIQYTGASHNFYDQNKCFVCY